MDEQKKSFNEFAIVSLVVGILSFVTLFGLEKALIAIVFGILALRRISRNAQLRGKGLAITGIVLGGIAIVVLIVLGLYFLSRGALQSSIMTPDQASLQAPAQAPVQASPQAPAQTPPSTQSDQQTLGSE